MDIKNLPDYPVLKKLANALWRSENNFHRAAVMVGAGFTRGAAEVSVSKQKPARWGDLANKLRDQLGNLKEADPLKFAEEYAAYHGKQALRDFLNNEVPDATWQPGEMHKALLTLPWSEVLTTNWDTLLERASEQIHNPLYSVVRQQEDLANAIAPRIVKLHGTINITKDLIFTQEDYRQYPQKHAAFVNFARQVFIENELCLLGFSGDDPNFLQWTGWVRDQLASHSRRIYLVGALDLTAPRRKYLESINIAPIDLAPLVAQYDDPDLKHESALQLFLNELKSLEPKKTWEWRPTSVSLATGTSQEFDRRHTDIEYQARLLEQQLTVFENDRLAYPRWLVCPNVIRGQLNQQISHPWPTSKNLAAMAKDKREKLLYEIAWRGSVTFDVINPYLVQDMLVVCDPEHPNALSKQQQLEIALILLQSTRWLDQVEGVAEKTSAILEKHAIHWSEGLNGLRYHQALLARDDLNYLKLAELTKLIEPLNPIWQMRKASLFAELGNPEAGQELIERAYKELQRQYRVERNSMAVLSQLAWAHWLYRAIQLVSGAFNIEKFPNHYADAFCSPLPILEALGVEATEALHKQDKKNIEASFAPGTYKDHSKTITFGSASHPILFLNGLSAMVGLPLRRPSKYGDDRDLLAVHASKLAYLEVLEDNRFSLAIRAASAEDCDVLKRVFSVVEVAKIPQPTVNKLLEQCLAAIAYWRGKLSVPSSRLNAMERLRVFAEVLARLSTRTPVDEAIELFRFAISLGKDKHFHHPWLYKVVDHLTENSLRSIPKQDHHQILLDALSFPLATEIRIGGSHWPNPAIQHPGARPKSPGLDKRIDEILEQISPNSEANRSALERLIPLVRQGYLTEQESRKLAEKIWGENPEYRSLPATGLLKFAVLILPSSDPQAAREILASSLYDKPNFEQLDIDQWINVPSAAQSPEVRLFPLPEQATSLFNVLVDWRKKEPIYSFEQTGSVGKVLGEALAYSIVESLPAVERSETNLNRLLAFMSAFEEPSVLLGLPHFATSVPEQSSKLEKLISECLSKRLSGFSSHAAWTIVKWRQIDEDAPVEELITRLVYLIGSGRTRGLAGWINAANELLKNAWLKPVHIQSLQESLPIVFDSTNYENIDVHDQWEPIDIPLIRTACVEISKTLLQHSQSCDGISQLLETAKNDPIPEVRHACFDVTPM